MKLEIVRSSGCPCSHWGGGSTTELFLYPEQADYKKRNFKIRVSSATVESEHSDFTQLPGVRRILMPLTAPVQLQHEGSPPVFIEPYEAYAFDGGLRTISVGCCTDLNLMLREDATGGIVARKLEMRTEICLSPEKIASETFVMLYVSQGNLTAQWREQTVCARPGDLLVMRLHAEDAPGRLVLLPDGEGCMVAQAYAAVKSS